jgi:cytochrome P450
MVLNERREALGLAGSKKISNSEQSQGLLDQVRKSRHLDFLDVLLTAISDKGEGFTEKEIQDEIYSFMFAGHDTNTSGMCWALYCLAKHPEHQEKVRDEVRRVLDGREEIEYEDLKELKYTLWCVKEAMRLYPPILQYFARPRAKLKSTGAVFQRECG